MTVENGTLADLEVDVLVAIDIKQPRAAAVVEVERHGSLHLADAAVDASGNAVFSTREEFGRFRGRTRARTTARSRGAPGRSLGRCRSDKARAPRPQEALLYSLPEIWMIQD